jgi:hypothetical protein
MSKELVSYYVANEKYRLTKQYESNLEKLVQKYNSNKINFAVYSSQKNEYDKKWREDTSKLNTVTKIPNNYISPHYIQANKPSVSNIKTKII